MTLPPAENKGEYFKLENQMLRALDTKGWRFADLAKATGIHRQNVWRDLRSGGLPKASLGRVARYAAALGLQAHYLLFTPQQEKTLLPKLHKVLQAKKPT